MKLPLSHILEQLQVPQTLLQDLEEPPQLQEPPGQLECPQEQLETVVLPFLSLQHLCNSLEFSSGAVANLAPSQQFDASVFKAAVVLEALSGESSQAELCRRYNLSEQQLSKWKQQVVENVAT
ncbi:hypothetical protein C6496_12745, partial [Candidatus Poribacteria bacterium]